MSRLTPLLLFGMLALVPPTAAAETPSDAPPCPTDLAGYAPETGGVFMSWTLNSKTDVRVYREADDGTFVPLERLEFPTTRYIDHDTEPGEDYRYQVRAVAASGAESEACGTLEVTTVPFFPAPVGIVAAALLGVLGYGWLRRRA